MQDQTAGARKAFGIRLRDLRRDAGLNGRELAALTGLHPSKISRIEHASQNPSEGDIRAWCIACGAEPLIPELIAIYRDVLQMWEEYRASFRKKSQAAIQARGTPMVNTPDGQRAGPKEERASVSEHHALGTAPWETGYTSK